ncbi:response regulator transcription factor [Pediococcus pentosaceus]|jgi:two-component system alkaline phosphatase synthesis response regulator PhoP|uniref:Response regulator n=3 Tax=Pediococcus pentosaceus TaxID=1255 RepID=A0A512K703_PEDPE|nr:MULTISPECIES: response regulator transcription factor [Pediococcus]ABJ67527.1 DNA-binding response regulator, OmpR family (Rec-wHTH domains) [Pediococcus pentosaceus ATCC 25745]AHA04668.1 PhoP family transcriptional regulator [Pediococcus pentosaceus SL4]ANI98319.1 DNA-binding response regulator [Pediococcus pentosaceus]ASC08912.1 Polar-differentiation response regulator DivK [Pediococcus pentosaceus]AVL02643.1 DNA-binding response regulator [Pediococcus pentosaceus]
MSKTILVVDDEPAIVTLITYNLEQANYQVVSVDNGLDAVEIVQKGLVDFVIMDLMLPQLDGIEATKQIRKFDEQIPIIMLTAKTSQVDKILGLELGADDYITKPFSPQELLSRIKVILRRTDRAINLAEIDPTLQAENIAIDFKRMVVKKNNEKIQLTPNEFKLLRYLYKNANQVLSRDQILEKVWGYEYGGQTRIVDIHISHLRDKLENDPKHPQLIKTIRGFGYEFVSKKGD